MIVMSAVGVLLGEKTDWGTSKKIIGESNFLNRLLNFDRDSIGESVSLSVLILYIIFMRLRLAKSTLTNFD